MTQSAEQSLLTEPGDAIAPAAKAPRKAAAKPRAKKAAAPASEGEEAPKPKARRTTTKKAAASAQQDELALEASPAKAPAPASRRTTASVKTAATAPSEPVVAKTKAEVDAPAPVQPAAPASVSETSAPAPAESPAENGSRSAAPERTRRAPRASSRRKGHGEAPVQAPGLGSGAVEEWSPSRSSATERPAPAAERSHPAPAPAPAAPATPSSVSETAAPAAPPAESGAAATARKYPVYIPRHVAKQMEEQGQTAPIAVPADAIPEAARAAVEAAQAAQAARHAPSAPAGHGQQQPGNREPQDRHEPRGDRADRGGGDRGDRHGRHDRNQRHERGDNRRGNDRFRDRDREGDRETDGLPTEGILEGEPGVGEGIVEISGKGFGFIRDPKRSFAQHPQDIFVTPELVRKYNLRDGQWVKGETRRGARGAQLCKLIEVNGEDPEKARILPAFDELTVVSPMERIVLYTTPERTTTRIIDLFAPIGKGQRGIIVAPPRTGKTTLLQHIADAVVKNHPDIKLIILLVDERPEEVTDIKRTVPSAEVMASSNDMDVKSHTRIAQLAIERAKRLVESGQDVFVLLDSITRVGRAFNNAMANGGRTMSGGVDSRALEIPRRLFAAARNTEEAGSLTIVATALIETGSKADELIFQEFKGTGNMELVLDRKISDQRIYPAIDIFQSGTRREELLIPADDLHKIAIIRRGLAGHKPMEAIERLLYFLRKFPTDSQMLREIPG